MVWQITVANLGPDPADRAARLIVAIPSQIDSIVSVPTGGQRGHTSVVESLASLQVGQSLTFTITGIVDPSTPPGTSLTTWAAAVPDVNPSDSVRVATIGVS